MTGRREDNAVRGLVFALLPAVGAWLVLALVLVVLVLVVKVPASVLFALAAGLIVGPLIVWAFRGDGVEDDIV